MSRHEAEKQFLDLAASQEHWGVCYTRVSHATAGQETCFLGIGGNHIRVCNREWKMIKRSADCILLKVVQAMQYAHSQSCCLLTTSLHADVIDSDPIVSVFFLEYLISISWRLHFTTKSLLPLTNQPMRPTKVSRNLCPSAALITEYLVTCSALSPRITPSSRTTQSVSASGNTLATSHGITSSDTTFA